MVLQEETTMRIVSLAPSNTEILYALGVGDQIVAVTDHCDYPAAAKMKPKVGGWARIDDELVKMYKPDLVLTSTVVQHTAPTRYKLQGLNVLHVDPRTIDEVFESWITIGKSVGKEKEAKKLVVYTKKKTSHFELRTSNFAYHPRLYCEEWHAPPMVSGNWVRDLALLAGTDYSLVKIGQISRAVTTQEIQTYDPEIIIINICGAGKKAKKWIVTKRPGWEDLSAVKTGEVWVIDDSLLNRPGPRILLGLRALAHLVTRYPRRVSRLRFLHFLTSPPLAQ